MRHDMDINLNTRDAERTDSSAVTIPPRSHQRLKAPLIESAATRFVDRVFNVPEARQTYPAEDLGTASAAACSEHRGF
jgi:hypothetical protein